MKTLHSPTKNFSQKGQGLLEYALLFGFVIAVFLVGFSEGGFDDSVGNLFGSSGDSVASVGANNSKSSGSSSGASSGSNSGASSGSNSGASSGSNSGANSDSNSGANSGSNSGANSGSSSGASSGSSSSDTSNTSEDSAESTSQTFKPLNWQRDIIPFADQTYNTIARNPSVDNALSSEIGFFGTLLAFADGGLASTNATDGTKDWESFLSMVSQTKTKNNIASSYVRDEQKISVKTVGKDLRITYSDKEGNYYYKFSPDANNVMQIETNAHKSYSDFFSSVIKGKEKGWQYGD